MMTSYEKPPIIDPMIYVGVHPVLKRFYLEAKNQLIFDIINKEIEKYGGIKRYRDLIILENTTYHCEEYRLAKNRSTANMRRGQRSAWSKEEDRFVLEHIPNGPLWMSYKISKSESAIKHRIRYLNTL